MQTTRLAAVIILVMAVIYFICRFVGKKGLFSSRAYNREKDRLLRSHIAKSLEVSAPIHLDISDGGDAAFGSGTVLSAAAATETVSAQMVYADKPWAITAPGGMAVNIEKDAVQTGMAAADYGNAYYGDCSQFSASSPFEHTAGNVTALEKAPAALHLAVGSFGANPALTDTLFSKGEALYVGGDDLMSQAVASVAADAVYVGEQYTELPDSLEHEEKTNPALLAMDVTRWLIIGVILIFAGVGLTGI